MANPEKHKKNPVLEWLEADESDVPASPRSGHVIGAYVKIPKQLAKRSKVMPPRPAAPKPDLSLAREPAAPPKPAARHSQLASWDHLKKLERLPQLRAPYPARAAKAKSTVIPAAEPKKSAVRVRGRLSTPRTALPATGGKPTRRS